MFQETLDVIPVAAKDILLFFRALIVSSMAAGSYLDWLAFTKLTYEIELGHPVYMT